MSYLTLNMKMIVECADKLAHLGEKLFNETEMKTFKIGQTTEFSCPDGYEFRDENGNVIEAKKIVLEKKKPKYPKTYKECCKVLDIAVYDLGICNNMFDTTEIIYKKNLDRLLNSFRKLRICCDAYWKIAGEEMGLDKPWKPDWTDDNLKPCIGTAANEIIKCTSYSDNNILTFPTAEMRDAFYENFKEIINECKELL